jgi:hypothetical protein
MSYLSPLCFIVPALIAIAASATAVTKILEAERGRRLTLTNYRDGRKAEVPLERRWACSIAKGTVSPKIASRKLNGWVSGMKNPFRYFDSSPEVIRLVVMMYVK